jgi:hypothetical protein
MMFGDFLINNKLISNQTSDVKQSETNNVIIQTIQTSNINNQELQDNIEQPARCLAQSGRLAANFSLSGCSS